MADKARDYDGPGEWEVEVSLSGSVTVTIHADDRADAERKACREADFMEADVEAEAMDAECVSPDPTEGGSGSDALEQLTGLELAVWAFTGKIPDLARARIREEETGVHA